jgi:hypothetical protein
MAIQENKSRTADSITSRPLPDCGLWQEIIRQKAGDGTGATGAALGNASAKIPHCVWAIWIKIVDLIFQLFYFLEVSRRKFLG